RSTRADAPDGAAVSAIFSTSAASAATINTPNAMTTTLSVRIYYTLAVAGVGETHIVTAAVEDAGQRLDRFLATRLNYSRSRIKSLIESGCVRTGATITEPSRRV